MLTPDTHIGTFIPISSHVAPSVLKTKAGDYAMTWELKGWSFVGRDAASVAQVHGAFNRLLQSMRAPDFVNVAFWVHDIRRTCDTSLSSGFSRAFDQMLAQRYAGLLAGRSMRSNVLYMTMIYRPTAGGTFQERSADIEVLRTREEQAISRIDELARHLEAVLAEHRPRRLGMYIAENETVFSEALEFHAYLLNHCQERVPVLPAVADYIAATRHTFSSRTGSFALQAADGSTRYGAMLAIKEYPPGSWPGVLNGLKYLDSDYVITHSFTPMSRQEALKSLERTKGMMISSGDRAVSQIVELTSAMDQLSAGQFVLGEYHFCMALFADDLAVLGSTLAATRAELSNAGFVAVREDIAIASSFYAQLPGNWKYRPRIANLSSLNFIGLAPLHNFVGGKADGNPWGRCISTLQTVSGQPYHFNFHATGGAENSRGEKALGNTLVIGKSGTGKTALINFLISQAQQLDPPPRVFFFDKDHGAEIFVRACGGYYMAVESGQPTGFNPLQCEASERNVQFLVDWVRMLAGKAHYSAIEEHDIQRAVLGVLDSPIHLRRMENLRKSLPNAGEDSVYARLRRWTEGNALGWVFDNPVDRVALDRASIVGVDYTDLLDHPDARAPVIAYLVHRLEEMIDGRPLIYVMDEFWKILEGEGGLKDFARNKQKTIRKQNGLGIFATQSPEDALRSDIAGAIVEQMATLILLPNPGANREDYIDGLKLNEAQYELVRSMGERSRCFLVKQGDEVAMCRLDLQGMDDVLAVLSASADNVALLHQVLDQAARASAVHRDDLQPGQWLQVFLRESSATRRSRHDALHQPAVLQGEPS